MSSGSRPIDLGPMYLPVGGEAPRPHTPAGVPAAGVSALDVARFRQALESEQRRQQAEAEPDAAHGGGPGAAADLAHAMADLWAQDGGDDVPEVRLGPHNGVLPGTAICMRGRQRTVEVELLAAGAADAHWLSTRLDAFAMDLGARLRKAVLVSVLQAGRGTVRSVAWCPERP
jgi:hypothetical protein